MTHTYAQTRNEIKRLTTEAQRKADGIKLNAKHDILRSYLHKLLGTDTSSPAPSFPVETNAELEQLREQLALSQANEQRLQAQVTALAIDTDTLTQELEETREALAHTQASLKTANEVINTMKASKDAKHTAASKPEPKQPKLTTAPQLHELTRLIVDKHTSGNDNDKQAEIAIYLHNNDVPTDALYNYLLRDIYREPEVQALVDKAVRQAVAVSTYVDKHDTKLFAEPAVVSLLNTQVLQAIASPPTSAIEYETTERKVETK